jgi:hypothetical protein
MKKEVNIINNTNVNTIRKKATTHTPIARVVELKSNACLTATTMAANCHSGTNN